MQENVKNNNRTLPATPPILPHPRTNPQPCIPPRNQIHLQSTPKSIQPQPEPPPSRIDDGRSSRTKSGDDSFTHGSLGYKEGNDGNLRYRNGPPIPMHRRPDGSRPSRCSQDSEAKRLFRSSGGERVEASEQCDEAAVRALCRK